MGVIAGRVKWSVDSVVCVCVCVCVLYRDT